MSELNNFEINEKAQVLADTNTPYQLGKMVVMQSAELEKLRKELEDANAVLFNLVGGWDYEEVAHHGGVDADTAARVLAKLNQQGE